VYNAQAAAVAAAGCSAGRPVWSALLPEALLLLLGVLRGCRALLEAAAEDVLLLAEGLLFRHTACTASATASSLHSCQLLPLPLLLLLLGFDDIVAHCCCCCCLGFLKSFALPSNT
jgi:hypothetical protein